MKLYAVFVTYTIATVKHELIGVFETSELAEICKGNIQHVFSTGTLTDMVLVEIQEIELNQQFPPAMTPMPLGFMGRR